MDYYSVPLFHMDLHFPSDPWLLQAGWPFYYFSDMLDTVGFILFLPNGGQDSPLWLPSIWHIIGAQTYLLNVRTGAWRKQFEHGMMDQMS